MFTELLTLSDVLKLIRHLMVPIPTSIVSRSKDIVTSKELMDGFTGLGMSTASLVELYVQDGRKLCNGPRGWGEMQFSCAKQ